jgi:hypothetical protein
MIILATLLVSLSACQNDSNPAATPTPVATVFNLSGHITDGTSHGVLPGINVQITSGPNTGADAKSDASGNYSVGNLAAASAVNAQFSATSYITQTLTTNVGAGMQPLNVVLQRTSTK